MVSKTDDEQVFDEPIEDVVTEDNEKNGKKIICRWCPAGPFENGQRRQRHERREHPDQYKENASMLRQRIQSGGATDLVGSMSEKGIKFTEALDAVAPGMRSNQKKQIILAFEQDASALGSDPKELEDFLDDCGLTIHQIRLVIRSLIPRSQRNPSNQVLAYDPRTGTQIPIILPGATNSSRESGAPMIITGSSQGITKDDVIDIVDRMLIKQEQRQSNNSPHPVSSIRRVQQPAMGADGQPLVDTRGQVVMSWIEEPIDPATTLITTLMEMGMITSPKSMSEIIKSFDSTKTEGEKTSPGLESLQKEFTEFRHVLEKDQAAQAAADGAVKALMPQIEELRAQASQVGLSDHQADLNHQTQLLREVNNIMDGFRSGLRADLQPVFAQLTANQLKTMGLSDSAIAEVITTMNSPSPTVTKPQDSKVAAAMNKWVNDN